MNKQIFYGQYKRIASFFEGTDLAATGVPTGKELELLETVRDKIPPEVFKKAYSNPVNGTPEDIRNNLRDAVRLFNDAGYEVRDQKMVNKKTGEPFSVEFLAEDPTFERVFLFYKPSLDRLGIDVSVRTVDEAQFENRVRSWDFDIITMAWGESLSPGNEQRGYWGSQSADQAGSLNIVGIKNPAVDAMIVQIVFSKNRRTTLKQRPMRSTASCCGILRRAAMDLWQSARTARWGPFLSSPRPCRNMAVRLSHRLVVGCGKSRKVWLTPTYERA